MASGNEKLRRISGLLSQVASDPVGVGKTLKTRQSTHEVERLFRVLGGMRKFSALFVVEPEVSQRDEFWDTLGGDLTKLDVYIRRRSVRTLDGKYAFEFKLAGKSLDPTNDSSRPAYEETLTETEFKECERLLSSQGFSLTRVFEKRRTGGKSLRKYEVEDGRERYVQLESDLFEPAVHMLGGHLFVTLSIEVATSSDAAGVEGALRACEEELLRAGVELTPCGKNYEGLYASHAIPEVRKWTLLFACNRPGSGPGCGCPDNDFLGEHEFVGTISEAESEAKRISHEVYSGDFTWWVVPS